MYNGSFRNFYKCLSIFRLSACHLKKVREKYATTTATATNILKNKLFKV